MLYETEIPNVKEDDRHTIGVLIGNAMSPHTMDLMKGIYHAAKDFGVNVLFYIGLHSSYFFADLFGDDSGKDYDYQFNTIYDFAWLGKVDALIIAYGSLCIFLDKNDKDLFLNRFKGIPHILLEDREDVEKPSYIMSDNYGGMCSCMEHLIIDHGYKKLIYLGGPEENTDAIERKMAYLDVMKKHNLPVTESMMEVGDYSEYVKKQVQNLLDHNPDAEALVCANDVMASAAYKECGKRGISIGKDFAITGYDDWESAKTMDPPLTTIQQNAYDMGYLALKNAVDLCMGGEPKAIMFPGIVKKRGSCGCKIVRAQAGILRSKITQTNIEAYTEAMIKQMLRDIILTDVNDQIKIYVTQILRLFVTPVIKACLYEDVSMIDKQNMLFQLRSLLYGKYGKHISLDALAKAIFDFIETLGLLVQAPKIKEKLTSLLRDCQAYIQAYIIQSSKEKMESFRQDVWFMPLIVRDVVNTTDDEEALYKGIIVKLKAIKTRKAYLYLMKKPIIHKENDEWKCPEEMYLAAYHEGEIVKAFSLEERPKVTMEKGFMSFNNDKENCCLFCYNIFAAERQYGILIGEISPEDIPMLYFASMQIGAALRYLETSNMQNKTQRKLEKTLQEIEDKNKVLNFLSEYDELTGCLNRRGFVERVITMNKMHVGEHAVLIFGDLDHLKEINDTYGHVEGDYAITSVGKIFKDAFEGESIIGRIGGDEFVMLFLNKGDSSVKEVIQNINSGYKQLNEIESKPYYIDISLGYSEFVCELDIKLAEILDVADRKLYEAKKMRRSSVKKKL